MRSEPLAGIRRLLVVRLDNIGDVIMLGPALRAIAAAFPGVEITLLGSPAGTQAAPLLPWIQQVIPWSASWQDISQGGETDPAKELRLVEILKERRFDAAFIFTSFSQSPYPPAYACCLAGIPTRVGQSKEFGGAMLSHWVAPPPDHIHQVDRNLNLLSVLGIPNYGTHLELHPGEAAEARVEALLTGLGLGKLDPYLVLAPGASAAARRYPPQRFAEVARQLAVQAAMPVLVIGTQREAEKIQPVIRAAETTPGIIPLIGQTNLAELAALIRNSRLVLTNNSASLHIADAFRRPNIVLYSGTDNIEQWQARHSPSRLMNRPTACSPCRSFQCKYQLECLDFEPEEVTAAALELLQGDASMAAYHPAAHHL